MKRKGKKMKTENQTEKKVIGITGGIGCGKSVVMSLLEEKYHGAVLLTDLIAHDLMEPGAANYEAIVNHFGTEILGEDKKIDRKKLGAIVFANPDQLARLNSITHPNVIKETKRRIEQEKARPEIAVVGLESALLFDTPLEDFCDVIWYIYADKEVRIQRLIEGRGYTREHCLSVMEKQLSEEVFRQKSDVVIDNSGTVEETQAQMERFF
jgi:dephospho-CoA kinase